MKKYAILVMMFLLSGCAWMNPLSWWEDKPETVKAEFEPNRFLWQAAKDKIAFMQEISEDKESGTMVTGWSKVEGANGVEFKVEIKVLSEQMRSDCLVVNVNKRLRSGHEWIAEPENAELDRKVEEAILNRARVLYSESLALQ